MCQAKLTNFLISSIIAAAIVKYNIFVRFHVEIPLYLHFGQSTAKLLQHTDAYSL